MNTKLKKINFTQSELKKLFTYDDATGDFIWLIQKGKRGNIGTKAGTFNKLGYLHIQIDGSKYMAHRLAFIYMINIDPIEFVDHIDGNPSNNSWANLRLANRSQNNQNQTKPHKNNKLGVIGVNKFKNIFRAQITINGKSKALGRFKTIEEASNAYLIAKRESHEFSTI